jgi:hypothetical protein
MYLVYIIVERWQIPSTDRHVFELGILFASRRELPHSAKKTKGQRLGEQFRIGSLAVEIYYQGWSGVKGKHHIRFSAIPSGLNNALNYLAYSEPS